MNQQIQTQEQIQANMVQALWVAQIISFLVKVGMAAFLTVEVLEMGTKVLGKGKEK